MDALTAVGGWPVGAAAVGVVHTDPAEAPSTVGPTDLPFAWASVTKLATALAVLVAVEEGTLDLDEPGGPPRSTVRHLLAHASGLGPDPGPPLARPGVSRIYSNVGFQTLGLLLADHSGMPFRDYLVAAVLEPLRMDRTRLHADAPGGAAAAGLVGPLDDLVALGRELATPTLVDAETHRAFTSVQFPGLSGVLPGFQLFDPCPWGLGTEIRGAKYPHWTGTGNSPATYGHFGRTGSFLWIDPVAGLLCAGLSDRPFGPWAATAWPRLADAVLAEAETPSTSGGPVQAPGASRT